MNKDEAQTIVIDVATKRRPHSRQALSEAVSVLETVPAQKAKKKAPTTKSATSEAAPVT